MTSPRPPDRVSLARRAGAWLAWWTLLMSFWVILDDSTATGFVADLVKAREALAVRP